MKQLYQISRSHWFVSWNTGTMKRSTVLIFSHRYPPSNLMLYPYVWFFFFLQYNFENLLEIAIKDDNKWGIFLHIQVLQYASETYKCVDTFYCSRDNAIYVICQNPMSPQRSCKEFWDTSLHTDIGFRYCVSSSKFYIVFSLFCPIQLLMESNQIVRPSNLALFMLYWPMAFSSPAVRANWIKQEVKLSNPLCPMPSVHTSNYRNR